MRNRQQATPLLLWTMLAMVGLQFSCSNNGESDQAASAQESTQKEWTIRLNDDGSEIQVFEAGSNRLALTQVVRPDFRPYLHPISAPDGKGILTEYSPGHHKHQTGLYWGFTRVNGRDYFHNPDKGYWRKVSAVIVKETGTVAKWQTVYDLLDERGEVVMRETQDWTVSELDGQILLDLQWAGEAKKDIVVGKYDYGGLFLRMPWKEGIAGEVVNAARQVNEKAEGQRSLWVDVGMEIEGRSDPGHIALFDHPENEGFPQAWRVDGQMGIGPVRGRSADWEIKKGKTEFIRHGVLVYTGDLDDLKMMEYWKAYAGDAGMYAHASLWRLAQQEALNAKFLTPEAAIEAMTVKSGFEVNAWAAEPMITQPMAFCWDDRGRMWIAENRDYESRGSGFSNDGSSRILILEDTDRDGVADRKKVFMEGIPFPAAIAVGFGGLYLGAPPNLLFVPDRDGDDKADEADIEVLLTGWGIRDRHETLNSFHWGPDGWLYGLEGFATPSKIKQPKDRKAKIYRHKDPFPADILEGEGVDINGGVWRYHPTKHKFEVVAHGFSNPWGIDYDSKGQLFITACVIPHMFHVIPGGVYHRQGGQHFNPYFYSDIRTIVDHRHRSAHGGARIYQSDAFPAEHHGRVFMANIHEHAVLSDVLARRGSGYVAHHGEDFMTANNAQWIGFSMEVGPEGGMYVLDWHDADICGKDVYHKETGRVFRIMPTTSQAQDWEGRYDDLNEFSDRQLADLQVSPSDWHARRARVLLQGRAASRAINEDAVAALHKIFEEHENADYRLRAMWSLHVGGGFKEGALEKALADRDEYIRAWAIQLLTEDQNAPRPVIDQFKDMARKDRSPVVRMYLAAALQRMHPGERWGIVEGLISWSEDRDDHNIPKMIWFGLEPLVAEDVGQALELAKASQIPLLSEYIARRAVDANKIDPVIASLGERTDARLLLLKGVRAALEGRSDVATPASWSGVYDQLKKNKDLAEEALAIAQQLGDGEAANQYLLVLKNPNANLQDRVEAMRNLADNQWPELEAELPGLLKDPDLRIEAIRAVAAFESGELGWLLLKNYSQYNTEEKAEIVQTMASRSLYGNLLTRGLKGGEIPKSDVPAYVARQLRRVVGNGFVEVWGPIDELSGNKSAALQKYTALLTTDALTRANLTNGRTLFDRTCGACHQMYGEGGEIGPDITGSNRTNLDYLLSNIIDPSGVIQDDYKMVVVTTRDGRTFAGNVAAENDRQLTLRVVGQDPVVLSKSDIQSREVTPNSMMPEGLLSTLSDEAVIDLVAYLQSSTQVPSATDD